MKKTILTLTAAGLASPSVWAVQNQFNPKISLIFDGVYHQTSTDNGVAAETHSPPGISSQTHEHDEPSAESEHSHHHELEEGFQLREQELALSASIDHYFDGFAVISFSEEGSEIEEAYFTTRQLPAGLTLKAGKFLSGIGYQNAKHSHQWNFADQNLAYNGLLGDHGLVDKGIQLTWLPRQSSIYSLFGMEWLQGDDQERFGTLVEEADDSMGLEEHDSKPKLTTLFAKVSPNLNDDHTVQLGGWWARAKQDQLILHHEHEGNEEVLGLEGDATLWGLDLVYKFDSALAYGAGDFTVQAEYLHLEKEWEIRNGDEAGEPVTGEQDGYYLQTSYGIAPRWMAGLRYDVTGTTNKLELPEETESLSKSERISGVVTWFPTEFSFIRLQYAKADIGDKSANQLYLQFNYSMGAHGAHRF